MSVIIILRTAIAHIHLYSIMSCTEKSGSTILLSIMILLSNWYIQSPVVCNSRA
jgi:hypothetical protein